MTVRILTGDCRDVLKTLDADSVQCAVTSPPYYGLRDYGVSGQIGLERSPDEYVAQMVDVFREVRRVLRDDGVAWLNLGDSYAASGAKMLGRNDAGRNIGGRGGNIEGSGNPGTQGAAILSYGAKPKDLLGIPWRVAFALQADGWWLRSEIIWSKPNPMPESVTDRPTSAHEKVFLLAKSERYFYDLEAIREPVSPNNQGIISAPKMDGYRGDRMVNGARDQATRTYTEIKGANARNVWTIATQPFSGAHFATMPPDLAERCVLAGTSEQGCCPHCGAPWERISRRLDQGWDGSKYGDRVQAAANGARKGGTARSTLGSSNGRLVGKRTTTGWRPTCACPEHAPIPCTVLDPFGGAGTTGLVANRLNRNAILIELNPQYAQLSRERIAGDAPLLTEVA